MARAKYYIKRHIEGKDSEELANFTRKDKAERFLNKLFMGLKEADRHYPYWWLSYLFLWVKRCCIYK